MIIFIINLTSLDTRAKYNYHDEVNNNFYAKFGYVNVFNDNLVSTFFNKDPIASGITVTVPGIAVQAGYNLEFNKFFLGLDVSYIYSAPKLKQYSSLDTRSRIGGIKEVLAFYIFNNMNGHRINCDLSAGYFFENMVLLYVGGIMSYNPTELGDNVKNLLTNVVGEKYDYKKITNDFGFGFKIGLSFKVTRHIFWDVSYRKTWFNITGDYKKYIEESIKPKKNEFFPRDPVTSDKILESIRLDEMIVIGIRFNL